MTALIDARPGGLDVLFPPGNTLTLELTLVDDEGAAVDLSGRTFTAALDAVSLGVSVVANVITVSATEAQTTAAPASAGFRLTETTGGQTQDLIIGTWRSSTRPAASSIHAATVVVTEATATADVTVVGTDAALHRPHLDVPAGWGDRWRAARDAAAVGLVRVVVLGDSIAAGTLAGERHTMFPGRIRTALQAAHGDGGSGWASKTTWALGAFGGPGDPAGEHMTDDGGWTNVFPSGPGGIHQRPTSTAAGATATYHAVRGETIDIVTRRGPGLGTIRVQVDGDTPTDHPQANATADTRRETVRSGLAAGPHEVVITSLPGGDSRFGGLYAYNDTGIVVDNISCTGTAWQRAASTIPLNATSNGLTTTVLQETFTGMATPVDLLIVALGVNDLQGVDPVRETMWDQFGGLYALSRSIGPTAGEPPEIVVVGQHFGKLDTEVIGNDGPRVYAMLRQLADSLSAPFVDVWGLGRHSWDYWSSLGHWLFGSDSVHLDASGGEAMAAPIIDLLTT
jgi:lysophospholipase L1-like esterase